MSPHFFDSVLGIDRNHLIDYLHGATLDSFIKMSCMETEVRYYADRMRSGENQYLFKTWWQTDCFGLELSSFYTENALEKHKRPGKIRAQLGSWLGEGYLLKDPYPWILNWDTFKLQLVLNMMENQVPTHLLFLATALMAMSDNTPSNLKFDCSKDSCNW